MSTKYTAVTASTRVLDSSALGGLGNAAASSHSSTQSNTQSSKRFVFGDFHLKLSASSSRSQGALVNLYVVPVVNNSAASVSGNCLDNYFSGSSRVDTGTSSRSIIFENIRLPPSDFVVVVKNLTGVSFGGSTELSMSSYSYEHVE